MHRKMAYVKSFLALVLGALGVQAGGNRVVLSRLWSSEASSLADCRVSFLFLNSTSEA